MSEEPDFDFDRDIFPLLICKKRDCRKRRGKWCIKFNTSVCIALGGRCDHGYYGEFKKMTQDILKELNPPIKKKVVKNEPKRIL